MAELCPALGEAGVVDAAHQDGLFEAFLFFACVASPLGTCADGGALNAGRSGGDPAAIEGKSKSRSSSPRTSHFFWTSIGPRNSSCRFFGTAGGEMAWALGENIHDEESEGIQRERERGEVVGGLPGGLLRLLR